MNECKRYDNDNVGFQFCQQCGNKLSMTYYLGTRLYICDFCGKKYRVKQVLVRLNNDEVLKNCL